MADEATPQAPLPTATIESVTVENPLKGVKWTATDKAFQKEAIALIQKYAGKKQNPEARLAASAYLTGLCLALVDPVKTTEARAAGIFKFNALAAKAVVRIDATKAIATGIIPTSPASIQIPKAEANGLKILGGLGTDTVRVELTPFLAAGLTR